MATLRRFRLVSFAVALFVVVAGLARAQSDHPDSLLLEASMNGYLDQARQLIEEQGANPNTRREGDNWTPLMLAAMNGNTEIVRFLLENQANPNLGNDDEGTPLCVAASSFMAPQEGETAIVDLLLEAEASLYGRNGSGMIPLMYAAREGKTVTVKRLLEAGTDPNYEDVRQWSALWLAVNNDQTETAKILLEAGADPDVMGEMSNWTPLNLAAQNNNTELCRMLLEAGAEPNGRPSGDDYFTVPLWFASMNDNVELVRMLLDKGALPNYSDGGYWFEGEPARTPLDWAKEKKNPEIEKLLRNAGAVDDLEAVYKGMLKSVRNDDVKEFKKLMAKGIDPRIPIYETEEGTTLLNEATERGNVEMVQAILSFRLPQSPYNIYTAYSTALGKDYNEFAEAIIQAAPEMMALQAVENWQTDLLAHILEVAPDVVHYHGWDEQTPLHMAVQIGDAELTRMLLEAGADVNSIDRWGESPLFGAVRIGLADIADFLLEWGADIEHRSSNSMTPLHAAALSEQTGMIEWLLEHGADLYATDYQGWNALHFAAWGGPPETLRLLIRLGLDVNSRTDQDETPLDLARRFENYSAKVELGGGEE